MSRDVYAVVERRLYCRRYTRRFDKRMSQWGMSSYHHNLGLQTSEFMAVLCLDLEISKTIIRRNFGLRLLLLLKKANLGQQKTLLYAQNWTPLLITGQLQIFFGCMSKPLSQQFESTLR